MRKGVLALSLLTIAAFAGNALAYNCSSAPVYLAIGPGYYEYTHNPLNTCDSSCWTKDSGIYCRQNSSCYGNPYMWSFEAFSQTLTQSVSVGASDSGTNSWELDWNVDLSSPQASWWDRLEVSVSVLHNGQYTNYNWAHGGSQGNLNCTGQYISFNAQNGDTIYITFTGSRGYTDAKILLGEVHIYRRAT